MGHLVLKRPPAEGRDVCQAHKDGLWAAGTGGFQQLQHLWGMPPLGQLPQRVQHGQAVPGCLSWLGGWQALYWLLQTTASSRCSVLGGHRGAVCSATAPLYAAGNHDWWYVG